jgi:predicted peptidase
MKFKNGLVLWLLLITLTLLAACKTRRQNTGSAKIKNTVSTNSSAKKRTDILSITNDIFKPFAYTGSNKTTIQYRLLTPPDPKKEHRYPLVLVLHGSGAIGTDNRTQLGVLAKLWGQPEIQKAYPAYILVPQFPVRSSNYLPDQDNKVLSSAPDPSLTSTLDLIDSLKKIYPVDSRRIYVIGFSMGASATINSLGLRPDLFAAAVAISGIPDFNHINTLAKTPIWFIHGNADTENPINSDAMLLKKLQALKAPHIKYWEIDGLAHEVYPELYMDDVIPRWLFKQKIPLRPL